MKNIYIIQMSQHYRDDYNYNRVESEVDETFGYFLSQENAQATCDRLNATAKKRFAESIEREWEAYRKNLASYNKREREIEVLKQAGLTPTVGSLYKPKEPTRVPEDWTKQDAYVIYEAIEIEPGEDESL